MHRLRAHPVFAPVNTAHVIPTAVMEYKTARVAVFRSKSLGYFRLAALVITVVFVFLRILLNNVRARGVRPSASARHDESTVSC